MYQERFVRRGGRQEGKGGKEGGKPGEGEGGRVREGRAQEITRITKVFQETSMNSYLGVIRTSVKDEFITGERL